MASQPLKAIGCINVAQELVDWKTRLRSSTLREEIAAKLAILDSPTPVIREIYECFPECQQHDEEKTEQQKYRRNYQKIYDAIRTFNPHSQYFNHKKYGAVAARARQQELERTTALLIPAHVETITGLVADIKAMNAASEETPHNQMRARVQALEAQDRAIAHGEKLQKLLNDEDSTLKDSHPDDVNAAAIAYIAACCKADKQEPEDGEES